MDKLLRCVSAALAFCLTPALAQVPSLDLVEFRNALTDQYFLTGDPGEIALIEASPAWGRTGTVMQAYAAGASCGSCTPVHRFYRPHNGSHFLTGDPVEVTALQGNPGLRHEGVAFAQNDAGRPCPSFGRFRATTLYRFYNNRPADPSHRHVTDAMREAMKAKGWIEEGPALCVPVASQAALASAVFVRPLETWQSNVRPLDECKRRGEPCLAVSNLDPSQLQLSDHLGSVRMKFAATSRGPQELTSAGPYYALGGKAFNPFGGFAVETELLLSYEAGVFSHETGDASSHVYAHPTLEFLDERSGRSLHFSVLTHPGSTEPEFIGRDVVSGAVIVGTTQWSTSPYGVAHAYTPTHGILEPTLGVNLIFDFRMTGREFQRVLARARQLEPSMSADPTSYRLTALRYKNEIAGNGMVDATFRGMSASVYESPR